MKLVWPNGTDTEPRCTGNYGPREPILAGGSWTRPFHVGADHVGIGPVKSIGSGVVQEAGWGGWAGNTVLVYLGVIDGVRTWVRYAHLASLSVKVGDQVDIRETIGEEGATGQVTGEHLHWEIYRGGTSRGSGSDPGNTVDPRAFVRNHLTEAAAPEWAFNEPGPVLELRIQKALSRRVPSRYTGPLDGAWGKESIKGIQKTIQGVGYTGLVDGVPGPATCYYVQVYAKKFGDYTGPVDRVLGPNSWAGFALGLERP